MAEQENRLKQLLVAIRICAPIHPFEHLSEKPRLKRHRKTSIAYGVKKNQEN